MFSKSSRIGQLSILSLTNNTSKIFQVRTVHKTIRKIKYKKPGAVPDLGLSELIMDKPPDYYETIQQKLDRINYFDNKYVYINIGYDEETQIRKNFSQVSEIIKKETKSSNDFDEHDFIAEFEGEQKKMAINEEDYQSLYCSHRYTDEYLRSTVSLGNHYGIYLDLFFDKDNNHEIDHSLIEANARDDLDSKVFSKRNKIFCFESIVPFDVEFSMSDTEEKDMMLCQSVYRGNLIPSQFGRHSPLIKIDASGINGTFKKQSYLSSSPSSLGVSLFGSENEYYTLAMINLDSHFNDASVCHWLVGNIHKNNNEIDSEEFIKYLPVHGIRGLGYHRYCFVLFRHNTKIHLDSIRDYDLGKRVFNAKEFIEKYSNEKIDMKPVGLSWFQTSWSEHCKDVYYKFLNMRSPIYEFEHPKISSQFKQLQFPGRAPFNLYLDHFRSSKDLAKEVLLERLKGIDIEQSYDPVKMYPKYDGRPTLPHIHSFPKETPDWIKSTLLKKREMIGRFRNLRASSARLPYNNNTDLDNPNWPRISPDVFPMNAPNPYPDGKRRPKPLKDTFWSLPLTEHHSLRVEFPELLPENDKNELKKFGKND